MSYFAVALARRGTAWTGDEVDLAGVEDLDGVVDAVRDAAGDDDGATVLLLLEENDEWFAVLRYDEDSEPRVFVSDARVIETSSLGAILGEAAVVEEFDVDDSDEEEDAGEAAEDEEEGHRVDADPVGDADLLSDLGTSSAALIALSAEEGKLPADILSQLCEHAGCLDVLESLRV